ncbi:MAG: pyrroline-5-carboxylate reductase [Coriobacteriales bacterium]|jgi:pyrroline-5-carboxylate reductase|nr:pyrroline-5-carboxylate reductase [Coriobacteriales bacterium]
MEDIAARLGKIAMIGGGKMGEAIVAGLVNGALFDPNSIVVADPGADRRAYLSHTYAISCVEDGRQISKPTTVILAVKPQVLREVIATLATNSDCKPERVISIAAGITTATIRSVFPDAAVIRVMPNAPLMVGAGMSCISVAEGTPRSEGELVRELFSLMGEALLIDEGLLNVTTALSGSGPAYFALFVEKLSEAGVAAGLTESESLLLAQQTLIGTGRYLALTGQTPSELRAAVTSPNGTTQAALECMETGGFTALVNDLVQAALRRAEELA